MYVFNLPQKQSNLWMQEALSFLFRLKIRQLVFKLPSFLWINLIRTWVFSGSVLLAGRKRMPLDWNMVSNHIPVPISYVLITGFHVAGEKDMLWFNMCVMLVHTQTGTEYSCCFCMPDHHFLLHFFTCWTRGICTLMFISPFFAQHRFFPLSHAHANSKQKPKNTFL